MYAYSGEAIATTRYEMLSFASRRFTDYLVRQLTRKLAQVLGSDEDKGNT